MCCWQLSLDACVKCYSSLIEHCVNDRTACFEFPSCKTSRVWLIVALDITPSEMQISALVSVFFHLLLAPYKFHRLITSLGFQLADSLKRLLSEHLASFYLFFHHTIAILWFLITLLYMDVRMLSKIGAAHAYQSSRLKLAFSGVVYMLSGWAPWCNWLSV